MPYLVDGDFQLFYQVYGRGHPLLLIHGLGSSTRDWEPQLSAFQESFQVITLDLRGHGRSGKSPGPYSMNIFADDTARLLNDLHLAPAHVLGISLGGMVVFQLALDYPQLVKKLVIVNSVPELIPRGLRDWVGYWRRLMIINLIGMKRMGQVLAERFFPGEDQGPLREIFVQRWADNHLPSYRASLKAAFGWSVRNRLREIQSPALILGAEYDYFPTAEKKAYSALMPNASLIVVPDSRHALPAEKPSEFNQIVLDFLQST